MGPMQFSLFTLMRVTMSTIFIQSVIHSCIWFSIGPCYIQLHTSSQRYSSQIPTSVHKYICWGSILLLNTECWI
jgi:hypothetical protein